MKTGNKSLLPIIAVFIFLLSGGQTLYAQGEILSVNPPSAFKGETLHLIIQGSETNFEEGPVYIDFDALKDYIEVNNYLVNGPELLTVMITIDKEIPDDLINKPFELFVNTLTQKLPARYTITGLEEDPEAMITVFPIQSIYISDYDFSNLRNLPLLFTISVYSPEGNDIDVEVVLEHEKYGMVASAYKSLDFSFAGSIIRFDNRDFDGYDEGKASDELLETVIGNGTIPSGVYTYHIYLDGIVVGESEFYIAESVTGIDMIGPGTPLEDEPEIIYTNTPYFQWFGGLATYNLTLYEVLDEQRAADDIATNIPVFEMNNFSGSSQLYPSYAESLEIGKKYAWQITSELLTGSGPQEIRSEMYWFIYQKSYETDESLDRIEIYPDDINLMPGDSIQIKVDGYNIDGDTLKVNCGWQVIPDDMGSVNDEGWFVAGEKKGTVAISASCGLMEDYVTVNIVKKK